ncbi:MAG: SIMPL domain-containing protein [Saprospiraceae bacterium]
MKKTILVFLVCLICKQISFSQVSGNAVYSNQNNQYRLDLNTSKTQLVGNTGILVSGNVLMNVPADYYIAIIGASEEAVTPPKAYQKLNRRIKNFNNKLKAVGIPADNIYIDATTQNRVYEHFLQGNYIEEKVTGFEVKKNIHIRYERPEQLEEILIKAADEGIYDLVKVDYVVEDVEKIYDQLFEEAMKTIEKKRDRYLQLMNYTARKHPFLHGEQMNIVYPKDAYRKYQAFSSTNWSQTSINKNRYPVKTARKMETFYFSKVDPVGFDKVINRGALEPPVQFILHLQIRYDFE